MVVASREFYMDSLIYEDEEGIVWAIVSSNQEAQEANPPQKGAIMGNQPYGGWVIVPNKNDPSKSHAYLLAEIDFKGYFPEPAIKMAFKDLGYVVAKTRKIVPKFQQKFSYLYE